VARLPFLRTGTVPKLKKVLGDAILPKNLILAENKLVGKVRRDANLPLNSILSINEPVGQLSRWQDILSMDPVGREVSRK